MPKLIEERTNYKTKQITKSLLSTFPPYLFKQNFYISSCDQLRDPPCTEAPNAKRPQGRPGAKCVHRDWAARNSKNSADRVELKAARRSVKSVLGKRLHRVISCLVPLRPGPKPPCYFVKRGVASFWCGFRPPGFPLYFTHRSTPAAASFKSVSPELFMPRFLLGCVSAGHRPAPLPASR